VDARCIAPERGQDRAGLEGPLEAADERAVDSDCIIG
jgi:hypothetical protein